LMLSFWLQLHSSTIELHRNGKFSSNDMEIYVI
jgi:hypothetical protein